MTETNTIVEFFRWWNTAMRSPEALMTDGFAQHFTQDARLVVNGMHRGTGPAELAVHYRTIADRFDEVAMVLPVEAALQDDRTAFVHCWTEARSGRRISREEAMARAEIRDGRMASLLVVGRAEDTDEEESPE